MDQRFELEASRPSGRDAAILIIAAAAGFAAFLQAHGRALDPIIDTGRDLYLSGAIQSGRRLYRDLAYNYPPFTPYALAGIRSLFGSSLRVFEITGAVVGAITGLALYFCARVTSGLTGAATVVMMFVTLHFAGATTWGANYLFPFAYAATIGMMSGLLFLFFFLRYGSRTGTPLDGVLTVAFGSVATFTKLEIAIAVCGTLIFASIFHRIGWKILGTWAATCLLSLLVVTPLLGGPRVMAANLLPSSLLTGASSDFFYRQVSGRSDWQSNLAMTVVSALLVALFVIVLGILSRIHRRTEGVTGPSLALLAAVAVISWILGDGAFFRGWAILQGIALFIGIRRGRGSPLALLSVFSILCSLRIFLFTSPSWYGFTLFLPMLLLIADVLFRVLPEIGAYDRRFAFLWTPLLAVLMVHGWIEQRDRYALKKYPIETPKGVFYDANADRAETLTEAIAYLGHSGANELVVFPEGASINYFTGLTNPLSRYLFTPIETASTAVEQQILAELRERRPERIAIVSRDVTEFGFRGFGADYDQEILRHLIRGYEIERDWRRPRFSMALLRLKRR